MEVSPEIFAWLSSLDITNPFNPNNNDDQPFIFIIPEKICQLFFGGKYMDLILKNLQDSYEKLYNLDLNYIENLSKLEKIDENKDYIPNSVKFNNWHIIRDCLTNFGINYKEEIIMKLINGDKSILLEILTKIYEIINESLKFAKDTKRENSPSKTSEISKESLTIREKNEIINLKKINPSKEYIEIESPLEFFIISLCKNFYLNPRQSVALLSNNRKYLTILCNKGIKGDFEKIEKWLKDISFNMKTLIFLIKKYEDGKNISYATIGSALCSKDSNIVTECIKLLNIIQLEIGTCWNWIYQEGIESFMFAINKHNNIKENLLKVLCDFIKEDYDNFINELYKRIYNNEKIKVFEFISSILPILKNINDVFYKKMQKFIFKICLDEKEDYAFSVSILGDAIYYFFPIDESYINAILSYFGVCIQSGKNIAFSSTITQIFSLLERLGENKNKYAPKIYKRVVSFYIKNFDNEIYKEFILLNFEHFFNNHQTVPLNIFLEPFFNKVKNSNVYFSCDLIFIFKIIEHPRISSDNLIEIIEIILDVCLNNSILNTIVNLILNLIFQKKLINEVCTSDDINYLTKLFVNYIDKSLRLYNLNPNENKNLLETPYDILSENFTNVNELTLKNLKEAILEYRKNYNANSNCLLGLLWIYPDSDDILLSNEEIFKPIYEPRAIVEKRIREKQEEIDRKNFTKKTQKMLEQMKEKNLKKMKGKENIRNEMFLKENYLKKSLENQRKRISIMSGKLTGLDDNKNILKKLKDIFNKDFPLNKEIKDNNGLLESNNQKSNIENAIEKASNNLINKKVFLRSLSAVNIKNSAAINLASNYLNLNILNNTNNQNDEIKFIEKINIMTQLIYPEGTIIKMTKDNNNLYSISQKVRSNYISSEIYKNFLLPIDLKYEENRENQAINAYNNQYKKNLRFYFRNYSNEIRQTITKSNFLKLLRDCGFDKYKINLEEINISIRNIFGELLNELTYEEYHTLLIQLSYLIFTKTRDTLTISECYGTLMKRLKLNSLTNATIILKTKMEPVIKLINKRIKKGKHYNLPPGFKIKEKTKIVYQNRLSPHLIKYIGEGKFICYQILEDIIFNVLNSSIIEPYVKIIKTNEIEIESGEIHKWSIGLTKAYVRLKKKYENYGIECADLLEDCLEKICKGKDKKGNLIIPLIYKWQNDENNKLYEIERLKEENRMKRRVEIKKQIEEYKKIKLKIKKEREENKEKERIKRLKQLNASFEKIKENDKKKAKLVQERKKKLEEENKNKLLKEEEEKKKKEEEKEKKRIEFFNQQQRKLKEQFKMIKDKREENNKNIYNMQPSVQLNSIKSNSNYLKKDKNYIEFEKDLNSTMKNLLEREDMKEVINKYKKHLTLIYDIYSKIGYNKISFYSNEAMRLNEFKEFLTNFTVLGLLITTDQMIYIYNKITQGFQKEDNNFYFSFDDFILSIGYLSIITKFSERTRKLLPADIDNCNSENLEHFFNYIGLKLPFNKLELENFINNRRAMNFKTLFDLQKEIKKEKVGEYKNSDNTKNNDKNEKNKKDQKNDNVEKEKENESENEKEKENEKEDEKENENNNK